ncbi:Mur ligase family protein, partial [Aeromonas sanarellii]
GNTFEKSKPKFAILNADEPASVLFEKSTAAHVITYGINNHADIRAENIQMKSFGTSFELIINKERYPVKMQLLGKFNVYNVLA